MGILKALRWCRGEPKRPALSFSEERCLFCLRRAKTNRDALARLCGEVDTLVLGSSHALWGYVAEEKEFNLSEVSGDFRLCSELLRYWLPKLSVNRVLLFFDMFSPGNVLVKSPDCYRLIPYCALYGIEYPELESKEFFGERRGLDLLDFCKRHVVEDGEAVPPSWRGNLEPQYYNETGLCDGFGKEQLEARVRSHVKLSKGDECRHLEAMRDALDANHGELVLIMPPVRHDYLQLFRQWHPEPVLPSAFKGCRVLDFMDNPDFQDVDFVDCDHLNQAGAHKLSEAVRNALR